jgi:hypothetical protein
MSWLFKLSHYPKKMQLSPWSMGEPYGPGFPLQSTVKAETATKQKMLLRDAP